MPRCCYCNTGGRCKSCTCVRNGRKCLNCVPSNHSRCLNSHLPGQVPPLSDARSSLPSSFIQVQSPAVQPGGLAGKDSVPSSSPSSRKTTNRTVRQGLPQPSMNSDSACRVAIGHSNGRHSSDSASAAGKGFSNTSLSICPSSCSSSVERNFSKFSAKKLKSCNFLSFGQSC